MALNKRKVLDAARKHAQKGAKAKALKEYNKLLKEDPRDAKLLLEVGDAYRRWGQNEEAIAQYGKVAQQYRQDGFDARAVAVFKQILNLDPKNYGAYVSLAELYQGMGLDSEAVGALQTAADGFHKEGRKSEALDLLRQMAALDPSNTTSRLKVAELLRQEGMEDEAVAEYEAVVVELEGQQERDQLVSVLERLLEVRPEDVTALTRLVRCLMEAGELTRAEPVAVRALDAQHDVPQFELLMELYAQMGEDAKLAEATKGLAKLHRERGDDDRARELMQRLPGEEVDATSASRMAVDVSEIDEPEFGDDELLDDDDGFLSFDGGGDANADAGGLELELDVPVATEAEAPAAAEAPAEVVLEEAAPTAAPAPVEALPEGDPDQLLAEASVYLRYGKRDQAIASLRGILAQEPAHRPALEKLGEAYAESGQNAEAVEVWLQAAEILRGSGDAEALTVLKDRIATLDPAAAESIVDLPAADPSPATDGSDADADGGADLDLDLEIDLDLDDAIDEVEDDAGAAADATVSGVDGFEIELDEATDSGLSADADRTDAVPPAVAEQTVDEEAFEFEFDDDEAAFDATEAMEADGEDAGADEGSGFSAPDVSAAGQSTATAARVAEELEEAEFYVAQQMYDEAESILQRILEAVPNHPGALLRMGEIASARGGEPDDAVSQVGVKVETERTNDFETTARFDEDESDPFGDADAFEGVDLDEDSEGDGDFEIDVDLDEETLRGADTASVPVEDAASLAHETPALALDGDATEPEGLELETDGAAAAAPVEEPEPVAAAFDPNEESFDLREALADVLEDDEPAPEADPNEGSGVLSTVEDGFESIFSDFKKGVTETLDAGDFDTRYDLGIAYREMGLYADAIGEFRVCLDSPDRRFDSLYLMGLCARDLGRYDDAVSHLEQALALPDLPEDRMAGVYFDLSLAEEGAGNLERACASLRRVIEIEADFPGAAERLASLESGATPTPELGEPGEAFETFDDLFEDDDDTQGDVAVAAAASVETFESFDDVMSEAEAKLDEADASAGEPETPGAGDDDDTASASRRGRKKISFV